MLATVSDAKLPEARVLSHTDYYAFGGAMPGRSGGAGYRHGFNGKENDKAINEGAYDFGARIYDSRIGRWLAVDPLMRHYPELSTYNAMANSPINAVDPDGKVIIFINGYYGFPTLSCCGGRAKHWVEPWIGLVQKQVGDHKSRFYDGSLGGAGGLMYGQGTMLPPPEGSDQLLKTAGNNGQTKLSLLPGQRAKAGYIQGKKHAADIINGLERDQDGNITESIKFVTSSMGAAYQRGFSQAITDYVSKQNDAIDAYNNGLAKNGGGSYADPSLVRQRLNVNIEFTVDLDAFQGLALGPDPNSGASYHMVAFGWETLFVGNTVPGTKRLGTMKGHHPSFAPTDKFPKGKQNPKGAGKLENPSN